MKQYYPFVPLIGLYVVLILIFSHDQLYGDEGRYVDYAHNILKNFGGFTDREDPQFLNGLFYSYFLAPFVALGLPVIGLKLLNAGLMFLSVILLYKTLLYYASKRFSMILAFAIGLNYSILKWIHSLFAAIFTLFVICLVIYLVHRFYKASSFSRRKMIWATIALGVLLLTKFIFVYVVLVCLVLFSVYYFFTKRKKVGQFVVMMSGSLIFLIPYFLYTYSITGKAFYLTNSSGEVLYWMTSRNDYEYGTWLSPRRIMEGEIQGVHPEQVEMMEYLHLKPREFRDSVYMARALENIRENPKAYILNVMLNPTHLVFDFPESYRTQDYGIFDNIIFVYTLLLLPVILGIYPAWLNRADIPLELILLSVFMLVYLGGSIMLITIARYFIPVLPLLTLWIALIYSKFVHIRIAKGRQ